MLKTSEETKFVSASAEEQKPNKKLGQCLTFSSFINYYKRMIKMLHIQENFLEKSKSICIFVGLLL